MLQDSAQVARDAVADSVAVAGHHFNGWWFVAALAVVVIGVGVVLWRKAQPVVVDNSRR